MQIIDAKEQVKSPKCFNPHLYMKGLDTDFCRISCTTKARMKPKYRKAAK